MDLKISILSNSPKFLARDLRIFAVIAIIFAFSLFNPRNIFPLLPPLIIAILYFALADGISKEKKWAWIFGLILFGFLIISGVVLFLFNASSLQNLILNLLIPLLFLISFIKISKVISGNVGILNLSFFVAILGLIALLVIQSFFVYIYGYVPSKFVKEVDLSSFNAEQCFGAKPVKNYTVANKDYPFKDKLEYTLEDDKGNYLQDLWMQNYIEDSRAKLEFAEILTDPSCNYKECKSVTINGLNAARVRRDNSFYKDEGEAIYGTYYYVVIDKLFISLSSEGYSWEESDENAKSAIECVTSLLKK